MKHADWVEKRIQRNAAGQFVKQLDFVNGDYDEIQHAIWREENSDAARSAEDEREIQARDDKQGAENERLASAENLDEFRQVREQGEKRERPALSEDMSFEEFSKARRG